MVLSNILLISCQEAVSLPKKVLTFVTEDKDVIKKWNSFLLGPFLVVAVICEGMCLTSEESFDGRWEITHSHQKLAWNISLHATACPPQTFFPFTSERTNELEDSKKSLLCGIGYHDCHAENTTYCRSNQVKLKHTIKKFLLLM